MNRKVWLNIHLVLVGFFMPLLIIIPLSGTQYLLGVKGSVEREDFFSLKREFTTDEKEIRKILKTQGVHFSFEYVKDRGDKAILRPSSRDHIEVHKTKDGLKFVRVRPDWVKVLQELHFGHGPKIMKQLQILFGISFFFVILSGFLLSWSMKKLKPVLVGSTTVGILVTLVFLVTY